MKQLRKKEIILLFDYDGTILDSLDVSWRSFNSTARKMGFKEMDSKKDFIELYISNLYKSLLRHGIPGGKIKEFAFTMRELFLKEDKFMNLFRGIKPIVNKLAERHKSYVITSNISAVVENSLRNHGIEGIREVLGGEKEQSKVRKIEILKKRHPRAHFYYIGDTIADIDEAKQAKIGTVAVTWGYHSKERLKKLEPDFLVDKPKELLHLFK